MAEPPSSSQPFHFPPAQSLLAAEGTLPPAQPAAAPSSSALGDIIMADSQDSNFAAQSYDGADEMAILNQLMEMPEVRDMLSDHGVASSMSVGFDQVPDANATFANMDVNLNPSFWMYGQDVSQYNDLQFNQLVNESQTPQPEGVAQEGPAHAVQVKTEEEL